METGDLNSLNTDSSFNIESESLKFVSKRKSHQPKKFLQNTESLNFQLSNSKSASNLPNKKTKSASKITELPTNIPVERKHSASTVKPSPNKPINPHTGYLKKNKILIEALISSYKQKRHYLSQQIASDNMKIGTVEDEGKTFRESKELSALKNKISMLSLEIEKTKIELSKFTKNIKTNKYMSCEFLKNQLNFFNMNDKLESLNKELSLILSRKALHIKKSITYLKTQKSRFNNFNVFRNFIFLELIGFGGFSEVYKGYDFLKGIYVALKIHKLEKSWTAFKKAEFIRRAKRECDIQCILDDQNIVKIIDNFSIDNETYCTVLEYVENSIDLETFIKERGKISEKSSKNIFAQILNGLKHLKDNNVIHYDLKPANILISDGVVKITDFGLSKQFPEMAREAEKEEEGRKKNLIEFDLTSAGAGTYHYLAPECFNDNAKISTRTDIWAVGCIFYQMLFGKKPFSEGLRAEEMWNNKGKHVLENEIVFDNKVRISNNAKKIILSCLSNNVKDRPEVEDLINFEIFKRREDKLPLVEINKTPSKHKVYKSIVTQLSNAISATNNKRSSVKLDSGNGEVCYYEIRDKLIIMLIVSPQVSIDSVFDVIGEVFKYFLMEYEDKIDVINRPFAAIAWQSSFEKIVKSVEEPVSKEKITKIGEKLNSIENIMQENIKELIQRGQKLEKVQEYSDKAQIESQKFLQKTNWMRLKQKYQNKVIVGGIVFLFLLLLIWYFS